ncbi:MAG: UDP-N-acetylglucosamine--N-acetylmuramyl-(pentapeptide) pyrophosphoryl-undecaprenol [Actinomycetota bacterium]
MSKQKFAVVTGGGTSGHVIPARAICEMLIEAGHDPAAIAYVGSRRGVEQTLMADHLVEAEYLPISGLQRSVTMRNIGRNIVLPFRLLRSRLMARRLIKKWQPRVVISVGGYASEPMSRAAIAAGIPLVCVSYDRLPGLATRRQAKHATVSAVAFDGSDLPRAAVTGAPVRQELRTLGVEKERDAARVRLGIASDAPVVAITGGSLGSEVLNNCAAQIFGAAEEAGVANVVVYHVVGDRFVRAPMPHVPAGAQYIRVGYESNMKDLYASLDVLVCRAGASTVAEIATVGIAAVVVPWPGAADNHQELNARWLTDNDAAILADDAACADGRVAQVVAQLLTDRARRTALAGAARAMGDKHRSEALVDLIQSVAR